MSNQIEWKSLTTGSVRHKDKNLRHKWRRREAGGNSIQDQLNDVKELSKHVIGFPDEMKNQNDLEGLFGEIKQKCFF